MSGIYRHIPDAALAAGKRATPFLMRALRDNDESLDHHRQALATALDETVGHKHKAASVGISYTFVDQITIATGVNDRVPFRFGSTSPVYAAANYSATLTAGTYTLTALATHIQTEMREAVDAGSPGTVPLSMAYDSDIGSETRGKFLFQHTGSSAAGNVLELHFASGTGAAAGVGPSIGFPKRDRKKAFGYFGASGFAHGYVQETVTLTHGGLLTDVAWVAGAFTAAKIAPDVIESRCFQNGSVEGSAGANHIQTRAVTGAKMGPPASDTVAILGAGGSSVFTFNMGQTGAGRVPTIVPHATNVALEEGMLEADDPVYVSGDTWTCLIFNRGATATVTAVAY